MFMVCMLHTLKQGGILNATEEGSLRFGTFWLLEILSYCAVDGFAFISGYMSPNKPRKYEKLVEMWFQAFFYSFVVTLLLTAVGVNESLEKKDMIQCAFPVIFEKFWYFSAFFVLYFAIPILNRYLFAIKEATAQKTLLALFLLFSVLSVVRDVEDPFGVQDGYSAIWLIVLYCMGVLAKRIRLFETRKTASLLLLWALCVFLTWGRRVFANDERLGQLRLPNGFVEWNHPGRPLFPAPGAGSRNRKAIPLNLRHLPISVKSGSLAPGSEGCFCVCG